MFVPQVLATRHNYNKPNEQTNADESLPSIPFATRTRGSRIRIIGVLGYPLILGQGCALSFSAPGDLSSVIPAQAGITISFNRYPRSRV